MQNQLEQTSQETIVTTSSAHLHSSDSDKKQRRGAAWVLGSFVFCPCHLPLTLGVLAAIFGGTVLGTFVGHYSLLVGTITTVLWGVGTWYGFRQLRARQTCAIR